MADSKIQGVAVVPERIVTEVRSRWSRLPLELEAFGRYAIEREIDLATLAVEVGADLYLTFACTRQLPGAIHAFHQAYAAKIRSIGRSFGGSDFFADEVFQRLSEKLFVASEQRPPGISQYRGEAPLSAWLNTATRRLALRHAKATHPERFLNDDMLANEISEACDQELSFFREQHRELVRTALSSALRQMPMRERRFLQLNLIGGISMDRIGKIYGISQSSVSRKIQRALRNVVDSAKQELRVKLRVSDDEIESMFRVIRSCIDLTFSQFDFIAPKEVDSFASAELPRIDT